jgi:hypothetical protein
MTAGARVLAIDWSGAVAGGQQKIWVAEAVPGELRRLECGRHRDAVADFLIAEASQDRRLIVGLDFAFSLPAWFLREQGLRSARELWELADREAEAWLRECRPPFWGRTGAKRPAADDSRPGLRRTDGAVPGTGAHRPKSVFQVGGAGTVGTGSLRGMRLLRRLHDKGFAVWPFDEPGWPLVVEIYPRLLTGVVVKSSSIACEQYLRSRYPGLDPRWMHDAVRSEDAFDAAVSALVMAEQMDDLGALPVVMDEQISLEGLIWYPGWRTSGVLDAGVASGTDHQPGYRSQSSSGGGAWLGVPK